MKTALFMYKVSKKSLPSNLLAMFDIKQPNEFYNLRSKSKEMFELKYVRTEQKQKSLSIHGVKIWNSIDEDIKTCKSIHSFKTKYKTLLLSQY